MRDPAPSITRQSTTAPAALRDVALIALCPDGERLVLDSALPTGHMPSNSMRSLLPELHF
jgi:hypothetical protein